MGSLGGFAASPFGLMAPLTVGSSSPALFEGGLLKLQRWPVPPSLPPLILPPLILPPLIVPGCFLFRLETPASQLDRRADPSDLSPINPRICCPGADGFVSSFVQRWRMTKARLSSHSMMIAS